MNTLPATFQEANALDYARRWVAGNPLAHPEGRDLLLPIMKRFAMEHPFNMAEIAYFARNGWKDADLALRELIAEFADRHEALPSVLAGYLVEAIHPTLPTARGRS